MKFITVKLQFGPALELVPLSNTTRTIWKNILIRLLNSTHTKIANYEIKLFFLQTIYQVKKSWASDLACPGVGRFNSSVYLLDRLFAILELLCNNFVKYFAIAPALKLVPLSNNTRNKKSEN